MQKKLARENIAIEIILIKKSRLNKETAF